MESLKRITNLGSNKLDGQKLLKVCHILCVLQDTWFWKRQTSDVPSFLTLFSAPDTTQGEKEVSVLGMNIFLWMSLKCYIDLSPVETLGFRG